MHTSNTEPGNFRFASPFNSFLYQIYHSELISADKPECRNIRLLIEVDKLIGTCEVKAAWMVIADAQTILFLVLLSRTI